MTEKEQLLEIGGADVLRAVSVEELPYILEAYADYLKDTFYIEEDFRSLAPNGTLSDRQTAEEFLKETAFYG